MLVKHFCTGPTPVQPQYVPQTGSPWLDVPGCPQTSRDRTSRDVPPMSPGGTCTPQHLHSLLHCTDRGGHTFTCAAAWQGTLQRQQLARRGREGRPEQDAVKQLHRLSSPLAAWQALLAHSPTAASTCSLARSACLSAFAGCMLACITRCTSCMDRTTAAHRRCPPPSSSCPWLLAKGCSVQGCKAGVRRQPAAVLTCGWRRSAAPAASGQMGSIEERVRSRREWYIVSAGSLQRGQEREWATGTLLPQRRWAGSGLSKGRCGRTSGPLEAPEEGWIEAWAAPARATRVAEGEEVESGACGGVALLAGDVVAGCAGLGMVCECALLASELPRHQHIPVSLRLLHRCTGRQELSQHWAARAAWTAWAAWLVRCLLACWLALLAKRNVPHKREPRGLSMRRHHPHEAPSGWVRCQVRPRLLMAAWQRQGWRQRSVLTRSQQPRRASAAVK